MAASAPAGFVPAKWIGPHDVTVPDREVLDDEGQPTGEVILAAYLQSGKDIHLIPAGEADQSDYWRPVKPGAHKALVKDTVAPALERPLPTPTGEDAA